MGKVSHDLKNERLKYKRLEEQYVEKKKFCQEFSVNLVDLNKKLEEIRSSAMTSEQRVNDMENMIVQGEKMYDLRLIDIEKINGEIFRSEQLLKEQVQIASNLEIEINLSVCTSNQLRKLINVERRNVDKIKMVVYEMEYRIDECEKKLYEMAEAQKQEVPEEIQTKILDLEKSLSEHREIQHSLQSQVDRLREDMRRLTIVISADKDVLSNLKSKCENFLVEFDISQKQIIMAKKAVREKQVEETMVKLRINYIQKDKKKQEKQIFNLEKLRLGLEQAMRERQLEITAQKQILLIKKRSLDEDRSRLKADLAVRQLKIEQYQKKYDLAINGLGKDDDGVPLTLTTLKIKNAQEKFFLQEQGDMLDNKIKTTEKEIVALENTLKIINFTNATFKNNLSPVSDTDPEIEEKQMLEKQLKEAFVEMKKMRNELTIKETELEEVKNLHKKTEGELYDYKEQVRMMEEETELVKKQILDKEEKLKRVDCELKRLNRQLKDKNKRDLYKYNRDFEIRYLQETNKKVLSQFLKLSNDNPAMTLIITKYLSDNELELPPKVMTPSSNSTISTPGSCHSSELNFTQRTERTNISNVSAKTSVPCTKVELGFDIRPTPQV